MASSTAPGPAPRQTAGSDGELVSYGDFIESQLGKTKTQVKAVEFFTELTLLGIGVLVYLSGVVLADHWLVSGGLGGGGRFLALLLLLTAGGGYAWWRVLPLLLRRINPIYAADAIERSQPSLKNSVINFLLLRSSGSPMSKLIYDAIEQRAATDLSRVTVESAVDRTRLIKIFYVLVGLVAVACVYKLASPKDPLQSVFRVVLPWMDLATPTRVTIDDVKPGNAQVFTGDTVTVTALVNGVRPDEAVTLYYTSDDQSISQEPITLKKPQDGYRHEAKLPAGGVGLGQNVSYYLEAGDVRSEVFRIGVQPPPTIAVEEIEYEYPGYTHLARHVEKFKGDIKAPEGTLVTIRAKANQAIEPDSAVLDLDSDGVPPALKMRVEGQAAWCAFLLNVKPDDTPEHEDYLLRFRNGSGQLNPNPIRYKIEILPDRAPTVEFVTPAKDTELPRNSTLVLKLKAADPDFALSQVTLRIERDGKHLLGTAELPGEPLLTSDPAPQFEHTYTLDPTKLLVSAGDEIVYWAVATDNKQPVANETASHHWRVKILPPIDPSQQPPKQDQLAQNDPNQKQPNPQPPKDPKNQNPKNQPRDPNDKQPPDQNQQPEKGKNDDKTGQPGDNQKNGGDGSKQNERVNPETDPGKAFEEILKQQKKEEQNGKQDDSQEQPGGKQPPEESADRKNDKQKPTPSKESKQGNEKNSQPQPDEKGSDSKQGDSKQDDSKQGDSKQGDQKKSEGAKGESGDKKQSGDPSGKEKSDGSKEGSQEKPGKDGQPDGGNGKKEGNADQKQGDTKNTGEKQPGKNEQQKADLRSGEKGEQKSGDSKPGDKKGENASEKNGTGKPEADKSGKEPNGEKQQGKTDTQPGAEKQPGETKAGDAAKPEKGGPEKTGELQPKDQADNKQETGDSEKGEAKAGPTEKKDPTKKPGSEDKEGGDREQNHGKKAGHGDSKQGTSNPSPQGDEKGRDKEGKGSKSSDDKSSDKGEKPSSPSINDNESDTEGKEDGDRKGGGKEGSGQKADKKGKGPAGTNTEANSGGSKSDGSGDGETGKQPGAKKKSEEKTGQSGSKEAGSGSESKQKTDGKGSGENPESKQGGKAGEKSESNEKSNPQDSKQDQDGKNGKQGDGTPKDETPEGDPDGRGRGNPTQGGNKNTDVQDDGRRDRKTEGQADEVNVDYANKATELALKHLKDELAKEKPNQELLDRLGWTREDMQKFVNRWDQMRTDARKSGPENADARRRWEDTLRGLGLSPGGTALDTRGTKTDQLRDLRERTFVPAPAEYRDRARGYKTGISKPTAENPK